MARWDDDYGVGKSPIINPPELELRLPPSKPAQPVRPAQPAAEPTAIPQTPRGRGDGGGEPPPPPKPPPAAAMYELENGEWEEMGMFDSDDLDDERIFVLLARGDGVISSHGTCFVWVGADADEAEGRKLGEGFVRAQDLPPEMPLELVRSGEEPGVFWSYFVNG